MKLITNLLILVSATALAISCNGKTSADPTPGTDIPIDEGTTVCGRIYYGTDKTPLKDVVVTDGILFTKTDQNGIYQLKSAKKNKLVYITVPSGYSVSYTNTQPKFYQQLTKAADVPEQHDFALSKEPGQESHTRLIFGDIHVYEKTSANEFSTKFVPKINKEISSKVLKKPYGLTLGDMTWDWFWYENNYKIPQYIDQVRNIRGLPIFCTVGNHDHDMKYNGQWWNSKRELEETGEDWTCEIAYRKLQGPTCYSCNIGDIHYISMDDALTIDDGSGTKDGRGCQMGFTDPDLQWLINDLSFVDPATPVVLSMHMPIYNRDASLRTDLANLERMLSPFKNRSGKLLILAAHIHTLFNNEDMTIGGVQFTEWTIPAVCGHLWYSSPKGMNICSDGVPGGYRIIEFNGREIKDSRYVPTECESVGKAAFYPFRSYDVNKIKFSDASTYPNITDEFRNAAVADGYWEGSSDNYVDIYVWDYRKGWSISVTETLANGSTRALTVENRGKVYDAISLLAMAQSKGGPTNPEYNLNTFRVKASAANTALTIRVTDENGVSAQEVMARPKEFSHTRYSNEVRKGYNK